MIPTGAVVLILTLLACAAVIWRCVQNLRALRLAARESANKVREMDFVLYTRDEDGEIADVGRFTFREMAQQPRPPVRGSRWPYQPIDWDRALRELPRKSDGGEG